MTKFFCKDFRPVQAEDHYDAARIFAQRIARRKYGSRAVVATLSFDGSADDGSVSTYHGYLGLPSVYGYSRGDDHWFILTTEPSLWT